MSFRNKIVGTTAEIPESSFRRTDCFLPETVGAKLNHDFTVLPKLRDIGRWHVTNFVKNVSSSLPPGTAILDAGAGECAYKKYFDHCQYTAVDLAIGDEKWNYSNLDYIAPLDNLPFTDASFDAVLCTQVLEHVEQPRETVKELYRVLKPGGKFFLTAPMAHNEHQVPYDFFRYTSYGLKSVCDYAGFTDIIIAPLGGMFARWAYEMPRAVSLFPSAGIKSGKLKIKGCLLLPFRLLCFMTVRVLQAFLLCVDRFDQTKNFPLGWSMVARK